MSVVEQEVRRAIEGGEQWREVGASGEPAFQNGWSNAAGGNTPTAFRKTILGQVELRGMLINAGGGTNGNNTTAFTLPSGYWPKTLRTFTVFGVTGGVERVARAVIQADGDVVFSLSATGNFAAVEYVTLEAIFTII